MLDHIGGTRRVNTRLPLPLNLHTYNLTPDLEIGTMPTLSSASSSSSDLQYDEPLLSKAEGIFNNEPPPSTRFSTRIISDATIGLSDGLTVPFALSAGLSALGNTKVVIYGGIAELIAGAISMGLGGYLAARSEA